ncbi:RES domain-containing protein [Confluentibacter flavum]|uniref:Uncharacterized protein n=1 Tax=Confluentibacter flavum TaxID=1909700 RepID=A0A2N3HPM1_9FLAO|nr:RES domain-containing protein [Confluentibacter flavum]PKQ46871.1 hypothetical protein CSW08_00740 [Confluentibacter flavum]
MTKSEQIINKLNELKEQDTISSYSHIKNILKNQIIPIPFYEYKPYKLIRFRRHNNRENLFEESDQLTYRKDILNITNFGRANEPGQGFFYCNDNKNQITGISEAVSIFRGNENSEEEVLTIGVWDLKESLKLAMILPTDENIGKNSGFDEMKKFYDGFEKSKEFEELKKFNEFIAKEFTLDLQKHKSNYKITCAFSNYIKEKFPEVDGILYASVKSEFEGTNIVLWPEVADEKLEFIAARKSTFKKVANKTYTEVQSIDSKSYDKQTDKINWK